MLLIGIKLKGMTSKLNVAFLEHNLSLMLDWVRAADHESNFVTSALEHLYRLRVHQSDIEGISKLERVPVDRDHFESILVKHEHDRLSIIGQSRVEGRLPFEAVGVLQEALRNQLRLLQVHIPTQKHAVQILSQYEKVVSRLASLDWNGHHFDDLVIQTEFVAQLKFG